MGDTDEVLGTFGRLSRPYGLILYGLVISIMQASKVGCRVDMFNVLMLRSSIRLGEFEHI